MYQNLSKLNIITPINCVNYSYNKTN